MKDTKKNKYPATCIVHWPSGPVYACDYHARALIAMGEFLGGHTVATKLDKPAECPNCVNESGTDEEKERLKNK
jgi:hypothetical protein